MTEYFLGIDVGTTAIKLGVISHGELLFHEQASLATYEKNTARFQLAGEVLTALKKLIKQIPIDLRQQITALGFSCAMHSLMPLWTETIPDEAKIYLWSDHQAHEVIKEFRQTPLAEKFYRQTGTPIHEMSPFAKIAYWQRRNILAEPPRKWSGLKELLLQTFTGEAYLDLSTASATGMLDLRKLCWDQEILAFLQVKEQQLAKLVTPTDHFLIEGTLAQELGLKKDLHVFAGASDGCLAALASYRHSGNPTSLTIGTSAALRQLSSRIKLNPQGQNFCYYLQEGVYIVGAPSNNGGNVLAWAGELFGETSGEFFEQLSSRLQDSRPGARGLRFWPFLNGERAPYWNSALQAELRGLTSEHRQGDILRGIVEGMLMNLRNLQGLIGPVDRLAVSGGCFQNPDLVQLTADIFACSCQLSAENEPLYGLYELLYPTGNISRKPGKVVLPCQANCQYYQELALDYFEGLLSGI